MGVCFFSPLMHGALTGKYNGPQIFPEGDFRKNVSAFKDRDIISMFKKNAERLRKRFPLHKNPVMHGIVDPLVFDSKNSCVLLGQRNALQVSQASTLGRVVDKNDIDWIKSLYRKR